MIIHLRNYIMRLTAPKEMIRPRKVVQKNSDFSTSPIFQKGNIEGGLISRQKNYRFLWPIRLLFRFLYKNKARYET